jgi:tetratricopeptide (TPR) repeat protein
MRYFLLLIALASMRIKAQTPLNFDKRFVECEDKWVAFNKDKDSSYAYGFIYIDAQAGLTLNYEGTFAISATGQFLPKKLDSTNVKYRLQPNNNLVAFIPESKYGELRITAIPEWLKYYKTDTNSVQRLYRWGYLYNSWDQCAKALTYLERAQKIDPRYKGLEVELAYSYNCLQQYDKAVLTLEDALVADPGDAYTNKELVYAQVRSGQLDKAAESCERAIEVCKDQSYNGENCYNLIQSYYMKKDKANFKLWLDVTKKWTANNATMTRNLETMEKEVNNWP